MLPALILISGIAAVALGFRLLSGRLGLSSSISVESLPVFYLAALSASVLNSSGWLTGFLAVLLTAVLLAPMYVKADMNMFSSKSIKVVKAVAYLTLFTAVFRSLLDQGLSIVQLLTYGAAAAAYTFTAKKVNKAAAYTASAAVSAAGVYAYFILGATTSFDVTLIALALFLYVAGSIGEETSARMGEALTSVAALLIVLSAAAAAFSITSPPTIQFTASSIESIPALLAVAFLTFTVTPARQGTKIFEAILLVLACSIAVAGPTFHEAFAQLATPITGEPVKTSTGQAFRTALQLVGISLLPTILNRFLRVLADLAKGRASQYVTYGAPALAVAIASASGIALTAAQTVDLAAAANLYVPAVTLASAGIWGLASAAVLLTISYNLGLGHIFQLLTLQQPSTALMLPFLLSTAAAVWAYSTAAYNRLILRRTMKAAEG